jgi:hypothetical protein
VIVNRVFRACVAAAGVCLSAAHVAAQLPAGYTTIEAARAEGALATRVDLDGGGRPLPVVLAELVSRAGLTYAADRALGSDVRVTARLRGVTVREALQQLTAGTSVQLLIGPRGEVVATARARRASTGVGGPTVRLSGFVRSAASREVVRRPQVSIDGAAPREGTEDGTYFVSASVGQHRLRVRAIGFAELDTTITLTQSTTRDLLLRPRTAILAAVAVQATRGPEERADLDPRVPDMSTIRLDLATMKKAPTLLGEPDPVRSLTYLPGVASINEGSTAFSVRGGAADQNLVLLDEAPIYNPSHVLGFLSTFNSDAVDNVTLYKGAIPARFGGRLSSVVDIRQREGNSLRYAGSASIGLLSSRAHIEGPLLVKGRASFMVAARRSYADAFLGLAPDSTVRDNRAYFYDINAKANLSLGTNGSLMLSGYRGNDVFADRQSFSTRWGNESLTMRWNQLIAGRLLSKVTVARSLYRYNLRFRAEARDTSFWDAAIGSTDIRIDQTWRTSERSAVEFGADASLANYDPGSIVTRGPGGPPVRQRINTRRTVTSGFYLGHDVELSDRVAVRYGIRYADFQRGPGFWEATYRNNQPLTWSPALSRYEAGVVRDSTFYADRLNARYHGAEPRISMRVLITPNLSVKASAARTQQFVQLVSNTTSPTPLDVWEPASRWIAPQRANQGAIGLSYTRNGWDMTLEAYAKRARNVVDYVDGADLILNSRLESVLVQGEGRASGVELLLRRLTGQITGWVSLTAGRAEQRFPVPVNADPVLGGGINGGRWYRAPFDRPINLSTVITHTLNDKWSIGGTFLLTSGLPVTLPVQRYFVDGLLVTELGPRNSARLPTYHRLDLSVNRSFGRGTLQLGVLNAYNRFNAQSLSVRQSRTNALVSEAVRYSLFGVVPSISYNYSF